MHSVQKHHAAGVFYVLWHIQPIAQRPMRRLRGTIFFFEGMIGKAGGKTRSFGIGEAQQQRQGPQMRSNRMQRDRTDQTDRRDQHKKKNKYFLLARESCR